jgi:4-amino-4-deoxy-L-arabinose transferase-like glycosyltransferase
MLYADEKFGVIWISSGIVSFLFFQFNRNAKLKKKLSIWCGVIFALIFLTWSAIRIWHLVHSITLLVVFMCPQIFIVPLIMLMNFKKTKICDSFVIHVEEQFTQEFSLLKMDAVRNAVF